MLWGALHGVFLMINHLWNAKVRRNAKPGVVSHVLGWFLTFLAPPGAVGPPPVPVTIPPAFVAYLLLVAAIVYDWRTRGRPHPVYVYGGIALLAVKLLNWPLSTTAAWHSLAGGILAMAQ